ncbi:zinc knuckle, partial [Colletotrichum scovillei]
MGHTRKKKKGHKKRTSRKDKPDNEVPTSSSSARQHEARDDEASASDSDSDYANNLDLIQVNLKRSPAHVIAIQDPPPEFAWKSCPGYNIEYLPARELLENDNPKTTEDPVPVKLVGFYVTQSIGPSDWRIDWREHDNDHYGSVASMFLNTSCGKITIHNVYNNNQSIFMSILLTDSDHPVNGESAVMVGDFNLHHPGWGGDRVAQVEKDAEILHQAISMAGMRCLLPPGLRSYSRSATDSGDFSTTIDLAFAGQRLQSRAHPTRALSVPGFDSDHRPLHTRISVAPNRDKEPRCNWDKENEKKYCKEVKQQFLTIGCPTIGTAAEVDDYAKALVLGIYEAARRTIPCYRKTAPRPKPEVVPEDVQRARENEENQLRILHELRCRRKQRVQEEKCRIAKRETRYATKMHKLASFRENIASQASQLRGLHQLARQVPLWSQLQRQVHLKRLIRPDGSVCQTDDESLHCFKDKIWPKTSDASDPPAPEIPKLDPKRPQLFTPQCISDDELHDAFTSVERGKAAGPDDIISNALKSEFCKDTLRAASLCNPDAARLLQRWGDYGNALLPAAVRAQVRRIVIEEDREAMAAPECHGRGLIPFCQENPLLCVERRVNLWRNLLQPDSMAPHDRINPMVRGAASARLLHSKDVTRLVSISIHQRRGERSTAQGCDGYFYEDFPRAMADIAMGDEGSSVVRCNFDVGQVWDVERVIRYHRSWSPEKWKAEWPKHEPALWETVPPLPEWVALLEENILGYDEKAKNSGRGAVVLPWRRDHNDRHIWHSLNDDIV